MSGFTNRSENSLKKTSGYMRSDFMIRMALKNNSQNPGILSFSHLSALQC